MPAGGFKTFNAGDVLTAADTNDYLMQGIAVFADATARDAAITSPVEGQACYRSDDDKLEIYDGSAGLRLVVLLVVLRSLTLRRVTTPAVA